MSKQLRDALNDAYHEEQPVEARAETLQTLHTAMRGKRSQRGFAVLRLLRYRMPVYQAAAVVCVLLAAVTWLYIDGTPASPSERIVYVNAATQNSDEVVRRVVDSMRNEVFTTMRQEMLDSMRIELQTEYAKTRRSLEGVTKKSIESVAKNFNNIRTAQPLDGPLQNDGSVGLDNLTQLQYQQRGRTLAEGGISPPFGDTVTSEILR